jgi:hypothetical protein
MILLKILTCILKKKLTTMQTAIALSSVRTRRGQLEAGCRKWGIMRLKIKDENTSWSTVFMDAQ